MGVQEHAPSDAQLINVERSRSLGFQGGCATQTLDQETLDLLELLESVKDEDEDIHTTQWYYDDGTVIIELPTDNE